MGMHATAPIGGSEMDGSDRKLPRLLAGTLFTCPFSRASALARCLLRLARECLMRDGLAALALQCARGGLRTHGGFFITGLLARGFFMSRSTSIFSWLPYP